MKDLSARVRFVLLLALVLQVVTSQSALAQGQVLQEGSKAHVVLRDGNAAPFQGSVTEVWDDGFEISVSGESRRRRVDYAEVESLRRSPRLGTKALKGALIGGGILGVTGFFLGYCFQIFNDGCAEDLRSGTRIGLGGAAIGAVIGGGIGLLMHDYGPFETVSDLGGPTRSDSNRLSFEVQPYPDGRIGLGVRLGGL